MKFYVFKCSKEDSIGKPLYSRFTKTNDFKGVPHPLSGDYTPSPQDEIDESLYVYGKKGPQEPEPSVSDDRSSEFSTCQSNDSAGSIGTSSEHSVDLESEISRVPLEVYVSTPITTNKTSVSAPKSKEVEPSCVSNIKTPRQPIKDQATPKVNRKNWNAMIEKELGEGYYFTKKKCFVCGSLSHLIKDCDYYEKKKAREAEVKRVVNTGNGMAKPVWTNANRVNHSNKFVPRSVQLNAGRPNINSVRPNINTGRTNINSVRPRVNAVSSNINTVRSRQPVPTKISNSFSPKRPQMNQINQRRDFSKSHSSVRRPFAKTTAQMSHSNAVKGNWGSAVKTSASYNWRNSRPNSNCDSGPTFIRTEHPLKNMVDRGIFDSGCSGHMTGNKDQLEDFEEFNGGSVTFGGSKGYISGTSQTPNSNASEEKDEEVELIVVPSAVKIPEEKVESRTSSTNSKKEETLTEPQKEKKDSSTDTLEDNPKIQAFRRELEEIALKHLGTEKANIAEAIRLDTLQKEEEAKQVHLDSLLAQRIAEEEELNEQQQKRRAQVQFEAQHYTNEDWDLIRAKIEANAELSKSMLGSDLQGEDFAKKMVDLVNQRKKYFAEERARAKRNKPMTQSQLKTYMMNYLKNQGTWKLSQLKNLSFEEVKEEFDKLVKQVESFAPINFEATKASLKRFGEELQTKTSPWLHQTHKISRFSVCVDSLKETHIESQCLRP
ncbi:hypothetical protein Tco_0704367 [Tanacetum coccineum]|uniref:Retrovirus-related Pol polyprotein from transposon TNT 1-94-like beta-barrel domain-containing protein n=1 Tax=Tanacetum coccineum TaxID=301880 RepID=A0ABQ4Y2D4_9ASTR